MSTNALTHQKVAREAVKMFAEDTFIKTINTGRQDEFGKAVDGYKMGDSVRIGVPPVPVAFDGSNFAGGGAVPAATETSVNLTLNRQIHVPLAYTASQKYLTIEDYKERFIAPAIQSLISRVQAVLLEDMKNQTPNVVGTWGTVPATRAVYAAARSNLQRFLAPEGMRCVQFTSDSNAALAEANAALFNQRTEIDDIYETGAVGKFANFTFFENQSLPLHANGAGTGYLVNGAGQTGSGLVVDTGTGILTKGTVFTIANVFAVHPITGVSTGQLRQFVVTADYAGGGGTVQIFPALTATSATAIGSVNALPADNAAITVFGTASQSRRQNLAYQKDAFTAAFAPLPILASCEGYTARVGGIALRVMTFGNGQTDVENTRIDVLFGQAATRPDHAVRITE